MNKQKVIVFATGGKEKDEGASGLQILHEATRTRPVLLDMEIVAVVSKYAGGGTETKANRFGIPFELMTAPFTAEKYQALMEKYGANHATFSGWVNYALGLAPKNTTNIHPGPTRGFGGLGYYGKKVHAAVLEAYKRGEIKQSAVTMHFVIGEPNDDKKGYDKGPEFFVKPVIIRDDDTVETLAKRVNTVEHAWQPYILDLVLQGQIQYVNENTVAIRRCVFETLRPFIPTEHVKVVVN